MTRFARRFRKVGRSLSGVELMRSSMDETFAIDERSLVEADAGRRFLDFYGDRGIAVALERYGFYDALRRLGYDDFELETWAHDERHTLLLDAHHRGARHRVMELVVRRDRLAIRPTHAPPLARAFEVLTVDWLSLRHPIGAFTEERLRLPGQDAPGLGVGERVMELLYRVVDRLSLDGLVTVAEYLHNAILYARELPFADPYYQGQLEALSELLLEREGLGLARAAWAMHWGCVVDAASDAVVRWRGEAMVKPVAPALLAYLASPAHGELADRAARTLRYRLDRITFDERWEREHDGLLRLPIPVA